MATIAAGGLVVAALALYMIFSGQSRKEDFAQRALSQARATAESGNLAAAAGAFQGVIASYGGTDAAEQAAVALNQARIVNGQYELAIVGLRDFVASNPDPNNATPAYGLLGAALENTGKWAEAAAAYGQAAELSDVETLKADYLVQAARAFRLADQPAEAVKAYRTVVDQYGETPSVTEAKVRLAEMGEPLKPAA